MGLTHVTVRLKNLAGPNGAYEADFLVDTRATDSLAPAAELRRAGIQPLARLHMNSPTVDWKNMSLDSPKSVSWVKLQLAALSSGLTNVEPLLGVTALESVGITIDPATRTLKRLPAIPLK